MSAALALVPVDDPEAPIAAEPGLDRGDELGEVADRPELDCEALCLCALLWAPAPVARLIVEQLHADDFYRPAYGALYSVLTRLITGGQPHSAPLVLAALQRDGRIDEQLSRALLEVTLVDARAHEATHYARAVLSQAYRRGYLTAATALAQIAEEAAESELFELMCDLGRQQRTARQRLTDADTAFSADL